MEKGEPMLDIKEYLKQTKTVLLTQDAFDELMQRASAEPRCETCEAFNKTRLLISQPQRKKGKWIKITTGAMREKYMCSICGRTIEEDGIERLVRIRYPFCHCGAEMRDSVETARDIVHEAIDNSAWSDTVDTAKMHKIVDDKYAEMEGQDE
jgi:hypothetical protein